MILNDGSAAHNTIVNIPTTESLVMNLKILGFDNIDIVADADTYRSDVWKDKRPLGGVYRSFHLLSLIYHDLKNDKESNKYRDLCMRSNYKFPVKNG